MLVLCNFLRKLVVSDKKLHRAFRTRATLFFFLTKFIREIFHFHHLPKLYIGFKVRFLKDEHFICDYNLFDQDSTQEMLQLNLAQKEEG